VLNIQTVWRHEETVDLLKWRETTDLI